MMDQMTSDMCKEGSARLRYARVLVEVDAGKEYLEKIKINYVDAMKKVKMTKWVKVEYSWKPDRCNHCKDDRIIVDRYILMKAQPPPEEMLKWTYDMKLYFKYKWDVVNRENESSDEEGIIEGFNVVNNLVADEIGGGDS
nr:ATPase, F1/V1/A1 complex, alpha/beta subunit, zinc knuckle CX2CX4HX4C [Tanacetum cinerariifolium]